MLQGIKFQWDTPFDIKEPVPKFLAYQLSVQASATMRGSAGQLWVELDYMAEDPIAKKRHAVGKYKIAFQLKFRAYPVTVEDLYKVVEAALRTMEIPIRRYYERYLPGIYCIQAPSLQEALPVLETCAAWLNTRLPGKRRC
ncbi:MAG TPA: hypothetical protein VHE34_06335 [Puia sp.]|uniref:hypothetical protein n=1 Tax=Puia sp. TaxID=2045100 RepID=UPI002BE16E09|nr:hypothetical protein [Puia sp.]HVU94822.1 hypothetical protein [Puia sp.]